MRVNTLATLLCIVAPALLASASPFETLETRAPCCQYDGYDGVSRRLLKLSMRILIRYEQCCRACLRGVRPHFDTIETSISLTLRFGRTNAFQTVSTVSEEVLSAGSNVVRKTAYPQLSVNAIQTTKNRAECWNGLWSRWL